MVSFAFNFNHKEKIAAEKSSAAIEKHFYLVASIVVELLHFR
jgi:hypothetical protein